MPSRPFENIVGDFVGVAAAVVSFLMRRSVILALRVLIYGALAYYVGNFFWTNFDAVRGRVVSVDPGWLTISLVAFTMAPLLAAWAWARLVLALGIEVPVVALVGAVLKSGIYVFLPGRLWNLSARAYFLKNQVNDWGAVTLSMGIEQAVNIVMACIIAASTLPGLFVDRIRASLL